MLILNKVKIAAAIFGIILLPVGAGIYVKAGSPTPRPVMPAVQSSEMVEPVSMAPGPKPVAVEALDAAG